MKTIQHRTTVKTVNGVALAEKVVKTTSLDVPVTKEDVLSMIATDEGLKSVCKYITDSLKLERNAEVRQELFPSNPIEIQRTKVKTYWATQDAAGFLKIMVLPAKQANAKLDEYYNAQDADTKAEIDEIEV